MKFAPPTHILACGRLLAGSGKGIKVLDDFHPLETDIFQYREVACRLQSARDSANPQFDFVQRRRRQFGLDDDVGEMHMAARLKYGMQRSVGLEQDKVNKHPIAFRWLWLGMLCALGGCAAVGPDYQAPKLAQAEVPQRWASASGSSKADAVKSPDWWAELSDPLLNRLVARSFATSPTLEAATAKLNQSRSLAGQAMTGDSPSVDGGGGVQRSGESGGKSFFTSWLSTNASWEIDLFGSVRRGKEAALAREAARAATLADARVSLAADVADAYLTYRACQSYVALGKQDVTSREATARLTDASVKEGFTAPYQAIRSAASVAEARTELAAARAQCETLENQITRLTGVPRSELRVALADKPTGVERLPVPRHFSVAIPSQVLQRRPDVRAAERGVAAASADIGVAEADRYPRITLNGDFAYTAANSGGTGTLSFGSWSFGPSVSLPIFDGGRRQAAVEVARARYDEAVADYKATTRKAIQELEDALTRYAAAHDRAESARLSAKEYRQFFDSVEVRFKEGASNLLELEDARRAMLNAQQTYLNVQREHLQAWIALNRSTGGGAQYQMPS
ncbi:MAG TPA: efflux transporter outer membrane subunit [Rhodocyclaceae bacterium]|nr:efflux transporter outer membrane subunit [Rhodocyclaceae bacterium]